MMRPCGACRALVPETGCRHWRPPGSAQAREERSRAARYNRQALERARQDVAAMRAAQADEIRDFQRVMTGGPR